MRQGCQFLSSLVRALGKLPGGVGRFLPCRVGTLMSRLRHLGWGQCSHGLTSRPLESCHHQCLKAVWRVAGYPSGSGAELLDGTLKLCYCTTVFTNRFPPWIFPRFGDGAGKRYAVTSDFLPDCRSNFGKRGRLTRKTRASIPVHEIPDPGHPTPRRWKRLLPPESSIPRGGGGGRVSQSFPRLGVG